MIKTGIGFDTHRLVPGRELILGGVRFDYPLGLAGHSDADVLAHAIADALLGAVAAGDLGTHFPDSDAQWKNANSLKLLELVRQRLAEQQARILHVDATLLAEQPRLAPQRQAICDNIAKALQVGINCVSVKASTLEGLGALGRLEGIAAMAVATVDQN